MKELHEVKNASGELLDCTFHEGTREGCLVVLGHGVTGNKDRPLLIALANGLAAKGWPCVRISFSGNGASDGSFAASTITKEIGDLQAVFDAVPAGTRLAYAGHSMGGAVGVLTAVRDDRMQILITLSGMVQTKEFCEREFGEVIPDQGTMWDIPECPLSQAYMDDLQQLGSTLDAAAAMEIPWLLVHGTIDDVVPVTDSEAAYAAAPEPKQLLKIEGEEHSFSEQSYAQIVDAMDSWLCAHWRM